MELELTDCGTKIRFKVVDTATGRIDGTRARRSGGDAILVADNEDAVWNVWREIGKMKETAYSDEAAQAAVFVQDEIESIMGQ